jgi:TolA-binding protein
VAKALYDSGNTRRACERLTEIISEYPNTTTAETANALLELWED